MNEFRETQALLDELEAFLQASRELNFTELEWEGQTFGIKVVRRHAEARHPISHVEEAVHLIPLTAGVVGTFHALEEIRIGDSVHVGQRLGYVEAMNIRHFVEASHAGEVADILVETGQPVDFGQVLFRIQEKRVS